MSAYGHQMDREYSGRSLSSRDSDNGVESGIYMSSFAATIFISGLVIVGVLLMTLLIALTVMLQSCQSSSAGIVEMWKPTGDYDYCRIFVLHAELNSLDDNSLPAICKNVAVKYIKEGQYMRDLNSTLSLVENYFNNLTPLADGHDVVLMDIDDILPSDSLYSNPRPYRFNHYGCSDCIKEAKHFKHIFLLQIYTKLQARGWPLILLSRKTEKLRDATIENLLSAGCTSWSALIMRLDDEMKLDSREYFSRRRAVMQAEGYHITAVLSSHMDALAGPFLGKQIFKLPNPIYYNTEHYTESTKLPQK